MPLEFKENKTSRFCLTVQMSAMTTAWHHLERMLSIEEANQPLKRLEEKHK
jgi:hypothetical protein